MDATPSLSAPISHPDFERWCLEVERIQREEKMTYGKAWGEARRRSPELWQRYVNACQIMSESKDGKVGDEELLLPPRPVHDPYNKYDDMVAALRRDAIVTRQRREQEKAKQDFLAKNNLI